MINVQPWFWRYPNFLTTQCGIGGRKPPFQIPARFVQSLRYGLWQTDGQTDGRTHDDSIHRASIASCGKKIKCSKCPCLVDYKHEFTDVYSTSFTDRFTNGSLQPMQVQVFVLRLKPSFSANPSHRSLLHDWLHGFPGLFTDISEDIRLFIHNFISPQSGSKRNRIEIGLN